MRLGVDFGTTRTTVALVDRGNYPLVAFPDQEGDSYEFIPSIVAIEGRGVVYGFEALRLANAGAPYLRSFKRLLASPDVNAETPVTLGDRQIPILDLVTGFLFHVAASIRKATESPKEILEVVVGIPAHAHSAQRFLTLEAFRRAGFNVIAMVNEPSAAGFEYTHRHAKLLNSRRTKVLVYDLGGGTFDASLVAADGTSHEVLMSRGDNNLGGDDFDEVLATCALQAAELNRDELSEAQWAQLQLSARQAKEALYPQSRHVSIDVLGQSISFPITAFYDAAAPLIDATFDTMEPLLTLDEEGNYRPGEDVSGIYVVGGGSELPAITRGLKDRFGRRIRRSPYTAGSQAIGLAIASDPTASYTLIDQLSRWFGVFREWDGGSKVTFDVLVGPDAIISDDGNVISRTYRAAHNVGWYRFAECTSVEGDGEPRGDVFPLGDVLFPFDSSLRGADVDLTKVEVTRVENGPLVEEKYSIDANGIVEVTITDLDSGYGVRKPLGDKRRN